ncbi:MAG: hypothetical protein DMF06_17410, partial [Verrucomicrobia bacterium]
AKGEIQVEGPLVEKREVKFDDQTLATVTLFGTTKPVQDRTGGTLRWILINILWGDEGALIFATRHSEIDVVITDMMMPVMDGPVTIQVWRNIDPTVRIIATSGVSSKDHANRLGVKHFLMKPYTAEILLAELKRILAEAS